MYNISSDQSRQTKSTRAGLFLDIGKVQQWMCTVKIGKFIQEYSAVYLTAALENILEEVLSQCLVSATDVTTSVLEYTISNSPDLWGIFQASVFKRIQMSNIEPCTNLRTVLMGVDTEVDYSFSKLSFEPSIYAPSIPKFLKFSFSFWLESSKTHAFFVDFMY